jgi:hypothetical protein
MKFNKLLQRKSKRSLVLPFRFCRFASAVSLLPFRFCRFASALRSMRWHPCRGAGNQKVIAALSDADVMRT